MLVESLCKGTMASTCTKMVSIQKWMNEYNEVLNEGEKKLFLVK